jgi:hypothetical protein
MNYYQVYGWKVVTDASLIVKHLKPTEAGFTTKQPGIINRLTFYTLVTVP